jgi:HPt (histidine-containing phosphotransfer) domain-containing protein
MSRRYTILALFAVFALAGCAFVPNALKFGGNPLDKVDKQKAKVEEKRAELVNTLQGNIHKAKEAMESAHTERRDEVVSDFLTESQAIIDQVNGAPAAKDASEWSSLVRRLLSENATIRAKAQAERDSDRENMAALSQNLARVEEKLITVQAKADEYAKERDRIADVLVKICWVVGGLAGLWVLGQVLSVAARLNPAFAGASAVVNAVAAPAVQYVATRAQKQANDVLSRVGTFMAEVDKKLPDVATRIEELMDGAVDDAHKAEIRSARVNANLS